MCAMEDIIGRRQVERMVRGENAADRISEIRPRWMKTPHDRGQLQFLQSRHKIRVAIPGNGWGKSTTMAWELDMAIQKDHPFNQDMLHRWPTMGIWVCPKFQQFNIIKRQLEEEVFTRPWSWNESRHFYHWPNGGQLHIVSSDSDWEHIQGIPVDFVCFDEHPDRRLWNEFLFRRRGKRKTRYMVAATMTLGMTWFIKEVVQKWEHYHKELGLSADEAREKQLHPDIWVWDKGGIRDNPVMDAEDLKHYESIGHASNKELTIRLEGGYADFSGDSVFSKESIDAQLPNIKPGTDCAMAAVDNYAPEAPKLIVPEGYDATKLLKQRIGGRSARHYVEWYPGMEVDGGRITVWEPPSLDSTYVIGADFAAGLVGRDYDWAIVLKKRADGFCEQVAEAKGWWGDANFAEILYMLGLWYFNAFICGERQFGLPALRRLYDEWKYPYIYRNRLESSRSRRPSDLLGHHRSAGDTTIPNLRSALDKGTLVLRSRELVEELRQYQYRPRHATVNPEEATSDQLVTSAPQGMNDDGVLALAYSWHAAKEVGRFVLPVQDYAPGTYGSIFDNARVLKGLKPRRESTPKWYTP